MTTTLDPQILSCPPANLLDFASIFIDFDGTLVEIADKPDDVVVDPALGALLADLAKRHGNRVALVSGRSIAQLDALIGPLAHTIALSGSHGNEYRCNEISAHPVRPDSLDVVEIAMQSRAANHAGVLVEAKSYGVALHYRLAPDFEADAIALAATLAEEYGLAVQHGKMMVEVRVSGGNKGLAIKAMMRRPEMSGTRPVFIGDDITDEDGFAAATSLGGAGILVGPPRATAARYRLADPAAVRHWLGGAAA